MSLAVIGDEHESVRRCGSAVLGAIGRPDHADAEDRPSAALLLVLQLVQPLLQE